MTVESANKATAIAAVASPWWLPTLHTMSDVAALALPIMGVLWLCVQIVIALYRVKKRG